MPAPRETDLTANDPILNSASSASASLKPTEPQVIYSPEYEAMIRAQKAASMQAQLNQSNPLQAVASKPVKSAAITKAVARNAKEKAALKESLAKFFGTNEIDENLLAAFQKGGKNISMGDWAELQQAYGLTNAQIDKLRGVHARYFGLSTDEVKPMPTTTPAKKPNYILWAAIAVGGFFLVRKLMK